MKKLIWTALATFASTAAAALAVRALDVAWRRLIREAPPRSPRWARMATSPLRRGGPKID
jgi:hypothetical protein